MKIVIFCQEPNHLVYYVSYHHDGSYKIMFYGTLFHECFNELESVKATLTPISKEITHKQYLSWEDD